MVTKTITVTTHRAINYGAVLQAYALQNVQKKLGYENEILDFIREESIYEKMYFTSFRHFLISVYLNMETILHKRAVMELYKKFENFRNTHLHLTKPYYSISQITNNPPSANCYVTGSDQVFYLSNDDEIYNIRTLNFGDSSIKRYSYAASLVQFSLKDSQRDLLCNTLNTFDEISLREQSGAQYLNSFYDRKIDVHIDPTLLLNQSDWNLLAEEPNINTSYILCYPLLGHKKLQKIIDELKKETNLPVFCIQTEQIKRIKADVYIRTASPEQFLGYIKNASYIVTTSFHGTALSIIYEKPFYTLIKDYKSERMTDLLELLGIDRKERIIEEDGETILSFTPIEYDSVNEKRRIEAEKSLEYLQSISKGLSNSHD